MDHINNGNSLKSWNIAKTRFDIDPDFDEVLKDVCLTVNFHSSNKLMVNIKAAFQGYKNIQVKYLSMATPCKKTEKHFCRLCHDNFRKQNRPLNDVRNRQQCWCFSDFLEATVTRAEGENISATKFFVYGLEQNYLTEKKLLKLEPVFRMKSQLPHLKYPFKLLLLFSRVERW